MNHQRREEALKEIGASSLESLTPEQRKAYRAAYNRLYARAVYHTAEGKAKSAARGRTERQKTYFRDWRRRKRGTPPERYRGTPTHITEEQKADILRMRQQGMRISAIARQLKLSYSSVWSFVRRTLVTRPVQVGQQCMVICSDADGSPIALMRDEDGLARALALATVTTVTSKDIVITLSDGTKITILM